MTEESQEVKNKGGIFEESLPPAFSGQMSAPEAQQEVLEEEKSPRFVPFFDWVVKIGIYLLTFLLPLFFLSSTANVLELNKQFMLFIFAFVLVVFWLAKVLTQRKIEIRKGLLNIFIILFLASALLSSIFAKSIYQGLIGFGGVISESFISLVSLAIIYFLAVNSLKTKKEVSILFMVLLASGLLAGIFGFFQLGEKFLFSWDFAKMASFNTVGSVNSLEIFLAAILVMSVVLFTDKNQPLWKLILLGASSIILLLMLIFLNFSNVWWVLIGTMIIVVGLGIIKQGRASQTKLILAMVVLAMALLLSLTKINISQGWLNLPAEVGPSFKATLDIDKGTLSENLFFGTGPGTFSYNWELYRSELINQTIFWNIRFTQGVSKVFAMPSTLGILGTAFWVLIVLFFAIFGLTRLVLRKGENWILAFGFFSGWLFLAAMQFFYPTNLTLEFLFWLIMGISLMLLKSLSKEQAGEEKEAVALSFTRESPLASVFSFLLVIFIVLTISFLYLGARYWWADNLFRQGLAAGANEGNLEKGTALLDRAILLNPYRDNYQTTLSQMALLRIGQELANPRSPERDANIQNFIAAAINISKQASDLYPQNPDNWVQRGFVYRAVLGYLAGAEDWMVKSFSEASALQPKNPYTFFELGRSYIILSDFTAVQPGKEEDKQAKAIEYLVKAEEEFNKALVVKNDYAPAHYQLALIYDRQGKIDSAIEKMEITRVNFPDDIGVAFQLGLLYYKKESFDNSQAEFERAVSLDENYSNARYFLGLIYDRKGDKEKAISQFEKVVSLNPENQEVQKILANLRSGRPALETIVPPAPAPEKRQEVPVSEKTPETR